MSVSGTISLECEARAMIDEKTYNEMKDYYLKKIDNYRSFRNTNTYIDTPDYCAEPVFEITTTSMTANDTFTWKMSARGTFVVDCGDVFPVKRFRFVHF